MKILLLAPHPFFQERGTPIAVRLLATELAAKGHQVEMLCYHEGEDIEMEGVTIHRIAPPSWVRDVPPGPSWQKVVCDLYMWQEAKRLARSGRFDLVHAVEEGAFMALRLRKLYDLPYIYDMDSCMSGQIADKLPMAKSLARLWALWEAAAVRRSAGVVAVCQSLVEVAQAHDPEVPVCRLEDVSLLDQCGEPPGERLDLDGPVIMYVGNLESYQGIDLLLEAFALTAEKHPQAHLVVIGGAGKDISKYRREAFALNLSGLTHFLGPRPQSQLAYFLEQADILVSPRIQGENTPMKIYSYLDSGRPLVATRLPTHTQVLDDGISLLVEPNAEAMSRGFNQLLEHPEQGQTLALAAKERVDSQYSLEAYRRKLSDFYHGVQEALGRGERR
ncbi:glycosyltransferase family 4 protein [Desulfoferula mesophila]|uniref:Glycoside hydrolase n=1 Tax=Desulfoferula mesophila TaxID=3058419 RepID=A0AAU9EEJ1_9BACT|nr:glycoside hydrolase [Desulfoferula mesophilus]